MIEKTEFFLKSTNGRNKLHVIRWCPEGKPRAILQISHGMCEYADRYDDFATFLARQGIFAVANDHLGHGETARDRSELGYFPAKRKSKTVVTDMMRVTREVRSHYPDVPFFMLGHSMGSFLARRYMAAYGKMLDGVILTGTGMVPESALQLGMATADLIGFLRGEHYRSRLLQMMAFMGYNKRIRPPRTEFDWLSVSVANVEQYIADPYCGFNFTVNGYKVLFDLLEFIQDERCVAKIPKNLPILMMYGTDDPVGHYGKDIEALQKIYRKAGIRNVSSISYPGDRHEVLNELNKEDVYKDVLKFLDSHIG